ncbi:MAG TPA: hypothetical protein VGJ86_04145 [Acidimicrobiales bacterium]
MLFNVLAGTAPLPLTRELEAGDLYTTGCAYYRLGRAVTAGSGSGSLSRLLSALEPGIRSQVLVALRDLPPNIGLIHHRVTVPVMLELPVRRALNMINAETLAVAVLIGGSVAVTADTPLLREGAADLGVDYRVLS